MSRYSGIALPIDTERAWAAGFFDGEGWFGGRAHKNGAVYLRLVVVQTETSTLMRFQAAVGGGGAIYDRAKSQPAHWSQGWSFQIAALGDLTFAVNLMWPYLSTPKRLQITEAFVRRNAYRSTWPDAFPSPQQRLSDDQVNAIRAAMARGDRTQRAIAAEFGVSEYLVSKIKHGKRRGKVRAPSPA